MNNSNLISVDRCFWCDGDKFKKIATRKDGVVVNECRSCHLLQVASMPSDLTAYYDKKDYFNPDEDQETGYHENYDLISPFYLYWQGALINEIVRFTGKKNLLEIGCATGNALEMIKEFNPKLDVQGVDISTYAVKVCREKGLKAVASTINNFKSDNKFDIVFSSETMEHVDDLKEFVISVKNNLDKDGVFIFYVPAVKKTQLIKEGQEYPPLCASLEHISYFTDDFLKVSFPKVIKAPMVSRYISTAGEDYHLGVISNDKKLLSHLEKYIDGFSVYEQSLTDVETHYNLAVSASRFGNFDAASRYIDNYESRGGLENKLLFLKGMLAYGRGELIKSREYFHKFLGESLATTFVLKVFLSAEREYSKILENESNKLRESEEKLSAKIFSKEAELSDYKNSQIVGLALKARAVIRVILKFKRNQKKNLKKFFKYIITHLIPKKIRKQIKYIIDFKWLIKKFNVINEEHSRDKPLVSVVIPYYNSGKTISETLLSLQTQTFIDFEVILVNDGSSAQESIDKLNQLDSKHLNLIIINQENQGVAAARNKGISNAKGKYVVCLDSDDILSETYLEKCLLLLETNPDISISTTDMRLFGVKNLVYKQSEYDPLELINNNMIITAAMFKKEAWTKAGGYKSDLGYEDWDFWLSLAENGYWAKRIPEPLFNYRTAISSRYIDDQKKHKDILANIKSLHSKFTKNIKKIYQSKRFILKQIDVKSAYINLDTDKSYKKINNNKPNIMITMPWMTFGGAETLVYNYCRELKDECNITFVTGLKDEHEWEYKFKEITPRIYHLVNLFNDNKLHIEFISNYIKTRNIDILHIVHNGFMFEMLPELRKRHSSLKIIVTMFNDQVEYFKKSVEYKQYIDKYVSDNYKVARNYQEQIGNKTNTTVIPNGINCNKEFKLDLLDRNKKRLDLNINTDELSVFFVGRLSSEKNPNIFLDAAEKLLLNNKNDKLKFFIIGDGGMRPDIEKKIKAIGKKNIKYLGYQTDVADFLSAADIFVLPSSIEGFPLSILEAMAMRVAVIASDVGAVSDVISDGKDGFIIKPGSVDDIVNVILKLKKDKQLLDMVKISARTKLEEKYSSSTLKENYLKLYKDILK